MNIHPPKKKFILNNKAIDINVSPGLRLSEYIREKAPKLVVMQVTVAHARY